MKQLQQLVNNTQKLREESWNDDTNSYEWTLEHAARTACNAMPEYWFTVYLLCEYAWNDAQALVQP